MHTDILERFKQYDGLRYYIDETGYIAWQLSTGENVELMFIRVHTPGKGHGTELLKKMVQRIKPFNSVFVFRLASNESAGHFYRHHGFKETLVSGLYKVDAVLGVANYKELCEKLGI
jgi:GNAT superfamily N-acetyltransferase